MPYFEEYDTIIIKQNIYQGDAHMRYVSFGNEGEKVSEVMLGLMRIPDMDAQEVADLIRAGLDAGIDSLDNADIYGGGRSEELLGKVFAMSPSLRNAVFLQTKCAIRLEGGAVWYDHSKEHILRSAENSLKKMRTDRIDSFLLHRPDALMEPEEIAEAFTLLHDSGKVRYFGVSNYNPVMIDMLKEYLAFPICTDQIQLSAAHTLPFNAGFQFNTPWEGAAMRDGGILEYCRMNEIVIQTWSSLQYGFFEGSILGSDLYPELNKVLDRIAEEKGVTPAAVAVAWILRYPAKMQAVVGTTNPEHLRETAKAADIELTRKEWYEIYVSAGNKLP